MQSKLFVFLIVLCAMRRRSVVVDDKVGEQGGLSADGGRPSYKFIHSSWGGLRLNGASGDNSRRSSLMPVSYLSVGFGNSMNGPLVESAPVFDVPAPSKNEIVYPKGTFLFDFPPFFTEQDKGTFVPSFSAFEPRQRKEEAPLGGRRDSAQALPHQSATLKRLSNGEIFSLSNTDKKEIRDLERSSSANDEEEEESELTQSGENVKEKRGHSKRSRHRLYKRHGRRNSRRSSSKSHEDSANEAPGDKGIKKLVGLRKQDVEGDLLTGKQIEEYLIAQKKRQMDEDANDSRSSRKNSRTYSDDFSTEPSKSIED